MNYTKSADTAILCVSLIFNDQFKLRLMGIINLNVV